LLANFEQLGFKLAGSLKMLPLQGNLIVESEEQIAEDCTVALSFMKELNSKLLETEVKKELLKEKLAKLRDILAQEEKLLFILEQRMQAQSPEKEKLIDEVDK